MKKFLFILLATVALVLGGYVFQDGADHAGERLSKLRERFAGRSETPPPVAPAAPVATPEPAVVFAPPKATPAPVATPEPAPIVKATPVPVANPDPNEPRLIVASLGGSRDEWPKQVLLKKPVAFPVLINGAVAGNVEVPTTAPVSLVSLQGEKLTVTFQGATQNVNAYETDLVDRVRENRRQGIVPNKPKVVLLATPRLATPEPKKSTFFDELNKNAKAAPKVTLPPDVAALVAEAENMVPTPKSKFEVDESARTDWKEKAKRYMSLPVDQVTAHPGAAEFPGAVRPEAPRVKREFNFAMNQPRWQSTGLYAAPGEKVTVHVMSQDAARGLSVVVGAHKDEIFARDKWPRFPVISRTFKITETKTVVANPFGGLIYINMPRDKDLGGYNVPTYGGYGWLNEEPKKVHGSVKVSIEGGVEAPLFVLGKTTPEQWQKMRHLAAPWGELAGANMILTVPIETLKNMENPGPLMEFWDQVVDAEDALAGWGKRTGPPERMVPDREISAGLMHSGYPIMCQYGTLARMVDLQKLKTKGGWGFFHEIGHNHEAQAYTFGGDFVEVTVNFFSLYVLGSVVKHEMTSGHPALDDVEKLLKARLGPEKNKGPFENLAMYVLPIKALGWESFQKTVASYSAPEGAKGIKTREDKMDQWVLRYSQATGKNLAPYFEAFEVACSTQTKETLKKLPVWLPNANFPKNYEK